MTSMVKVGKWIAKHKVLVLLIGLLLVIPSVIELQRQELITIC